MTTRPDLPSVLDEALVPLGFARERGGRQWVRAAGAREHVVGMRRGRTGGGTALYISERSPGQEPECFFELSPVAPLSNTYWWPARLTDDALQALRAQLAQVALPYFAVPACEPAQLQRLIQAPLEPLRRFEPGFALGEGGTWWRLRGRVIDLVIADGLALNRFVRPWVAVWHQDLPQGLSGPLPEGVTHAASHTLGRDGIDGEPMGALFALSGPDGWADNAPSWLVAAQAWFDAIQTAADVLGQVRPEYRPSMTGST